MVTEAQVSTKAVARWVIGSMLVGVIIATSVWVVKNLISAHENSAYSTYRVEQAQCEAANRDNTPRLFKHTHIDIYNIEIGTVVAAVPEEGLYKCDVVIVDREGNSQTLLGYVASEAIRENDALKIQKNRVGDHTKLYKSKPN